MKEVLINIAEGCVDIIKNSSDTKEARKLIRLQIQAAYDAGFADGKKSDKPAGLTRPQVPADRAPVVQLDTAEEEY